MTDFSIADYLEAKDTKRKCSPKKNIFKKLFKQPLKQKSLQVFREVCRVFQQTFNDSK